MIGLLEGVKLAVALVGGAGYAAYKLGWLEKASLAGPRRSTRFKPRPPISPRKSSFEPVLMDLCPIDRPLLMRTTAKLKSMGFSIVGDFAVRSLEESWFRAFAHDSEPLYAVVAQHSARGRPPFHLDFFSAFEDGSFQTTSNSDEPADKHRPVLTRLSLEPGLLPEELYVRHMALIKDLKALTASRMEFFDRYRQALVADAVLRSKRPAPGALPKLLESLEPLAVEALTRRFAPAPVAVPLPARLPEPEPEPSPEQTAEIPRARLCLNCGSRPLVSYSQRCHKCHFPLEAASAESSAAVAGEIAPDRTIETSA